MNPSGNEVLQKAWQLCHQGHFGDAQRLLATHLKRSANDVEAWSLISKLYLQQRDYARAMTSAATAVRLDPANSQALYTLGRAHRGNGTLDSAEDCYRKALALTPEQPDILTSLGVLLRARGATEEAIALYRRALAINPGHAEAANNLSNALAEVGASDEAQALRQLGRPALAARLTQMRESVAALLEAGRIVDARAVVMDALRIAPLDAGFWLAAGKIESALGRTQTGLNHVEEAARLDPNSIEANEIALSSCAAAGLREPALRYSERMLELAPTPDILLTQQLLLPAIERSRESICETRARYTQGLADALASDAPLRGPAAIHGAQTFVVASHPGFYLAYHGENNRELHTQLACMYLKRIPDLKITAPHCMLDQRSPGRTRVGFISRFLCSHSIGKTTRGLIDRLSREIFEVYALRITPADEDNVTRMIRAAADRTVDLDADFRVARQQIAALELDVLFYQDIGMEPMSYFLAFSRLAPVQCVSFGHPDTTGIPNMDYFISNDLFEPDNARAHYSEELFLLRDLPTLAYYYRPTLDKQPSRGNFGFSADETLYLCPQTLFKLHPDFDELLHGILSRDPKGLIVLLEGSFDGWSDALKMRFRTAFPALAHRVRFVPRLAFSAFLELLAICDVVLDTPHFNGMNSSLEALAMGTPVVTWPAAMQRGRHTYGMYRKMGMLDTVASDADSYIDIAVRLGTDASYAQSIRARILERNCVLYEDARVVREFERFFVEAVARRSTRE
jgi:predicted O-linked N-acetylglucosamine transferase (SPINDLY family)